MMMRSAALILALLWSGPASAETVDAGTLEIESDGRALRFTVEIADEPEERSRGLMFRQSLADDAGMLFLYPSDQIASFWMKNTLIPLDMIFIRADGVVAQVSPEATPHSLTPIRSQVPVRAVLEVRGGLAEELGIDPGDRVRLLDRFPLPSPE